LPAAVELFFGCHTIRRWCEKATFEGCEPTGYLFRCSFTVPVPPRYLGFTLTMTVWGTHGRYVVSDAVAEFQGD